MATYDLTKGIAFLNDSFETEIGDYTLHSSLTETIDTANQCLKIVASATNTNNTAYLMKKTFGTAISAGHKIYMRVSLNFTSAGTNAFPAIWLCRSSDGTDETSWVNAYASNSAYGDGAWTTWSGLTVNNNYVTTKIGLGIRQSISGDILLLKDLKLFDLTDMFGVGNEPTKEWCDKNLKNSSGTITNLATARTAAFTNMEAPVKGVFTHGANQLALLQHNMETPIYGHKYYGRCYQKAPAGHTWGDARFEYYAEDVAGTGLMVFGTMEPTNNEWKMLSSIQTLAGEPTGTTWVLRSFVSNGNADSYRKEILIVDLTETYGAGNEPTKEWCDKNIPFFEGTLTLIPSLKEGDIINCPYNGAKQGVMLPIGKYKLETWGAAGGSKSEPQATGGEGGYSTGVLFKNKPVGLIVYPGGRGTYGTSSTYTAVSGGGFNGGGNAGYYGGAGGGGSDFRIGYDSLYARVLVAGGGGGAYAYSTTYKASGGNGGGPVGEIGGYYSSSYTTYRGNPGTLTVGGASGSGITSGNWDGKAGTFGVGGDTGYKYNSTSYYSCGAGGGGWYGGGAADNYNGSYSRTRYASGGGGGSSYYWSAGSAEFYPNGCLLSEEDYLEDGYFRQGGWRSDGKCRIVVLNLGNLDNSVRIGSQEIKQIELEDSLITKVYLGEQQIAPKMPKFLDYIESNGTQYIDTGVIPTSATKIVTKFEFPTSTQTTYAGFFGAQIDESNTYGYVLSNTASGKIQFKGGTTYMGGPAFAINTPYEITCSLNSFIINGTSYTATDTWSQTINDTIYIWGRNTAKTVLDTTLTTAKLYYFQIYENNILIKDFKPALDNQNRPCLYDLVEQKYYYSLSSSDLLAPTYKTLQVTRAILDTGTFKNVTPTYLTGQQNSSDGFKIAGTVANTNQNFNDLLRWDYTLDLTDYNKLIFYCKKDVNHGMCRIYIDGEMFFGYIHYNDLPTSWTQYIVDLSGWNGEHTVSFVGGYNDSTGSTSSATSYCDIKFLGAI